MSHYWNDAREEETIYLHALNASVQAAQFADRLGHRIEPLSTIWWAAENLTSIAMDNGGDFDDAEALFAFFLKGVSYHLENTKIDFRTIVIGIIESSTEFNPKEESVDEARDRLGLV